MTPSLIILEAIKIHSPDPYRDSRYGLRIWTRFTLAESYAVHCAHDGTTRAHGERILRQGSRKLDIDHKLTNYF